MTTFTLSRTDEQRLVAEVEAFLASQPEVPPVERVLTAHPLLSRSTADLVAEVESNLPAQAPSLSAPPRWTRWLPESLWRLVGATRPRRDVSVSEYLALLVLVLERHGWDGSGRGRSVDGCRCIAWSQRLLATLGYGSAETADAASRAIQGVLHRRGVTVPYWEWNDVPGRRRSEVLGLIREAGAS